MCHGYALEFVLNSILAEEKNFKNYGLPKFASGPPLALLKVGMTKISENHETLSVVQHVGLHVEFSSMESSSGL